MSTKIDQSLDEIMANTGATRNRGGPRGPRRRQGRKAAGSAVAPVGGITKSARAPKSAVKPVPTGPAANRDSKILVSNLPKDIDAKQIKEYFSETCGPVKRVDIAYGPNGVSRGMANIIFSKADCATKAASQLNGIFVDGKPIRIEILLDASQAPAVSAPKSLSERITQPKAQPKVQPKAQPKSAAGTKATKGAAGNNAAAAGAKKGRSRKPRSARPAKKTKEELDSEMMDYFPSENAAAPAAASAPAAATGGDAAMVDEIL